MPTVGYCSNLTMRIDADQKSKSWNLDSVQVSFQESYCNHFASFKGLIKDQQPSVTIPTMVSR